MSQTKILIDFMGKKPGQTTTEFAAELKQLSTEEKFELATLALIELKKQNRAAGDAVVDV